MGDSFMMWEQSHMNIKASNMDEQSKSEMCKAIDNMLRQAYYADRKRIAFELKQQAEYVLASRDRAQSLINGRPDSVISALLQQFDVVRLMNNQPLLNLVSGQLMSECNRVEFQQSGSMPFPPFQLPPPFPFPNSAVSVAQTANLMSAVSIFDTAAFPMPAESFPETAAPRTPAESIPKTAAINPPVAPTTTSAAALQSPRSSSPATTTSTSSSISCETVDSAKKKESSRMETSDPSHVSNQSVDPPSEKKQKPPGVKPSTPAAKANTSGPALQRPRSVGKFESSAPTPSQAKGETTKNDPKRAPSKPSPRPTQSANASKSSPQSGPAATPSSSDSSLTAYQKALREEFMNLNGALQREAFEKVHGPDWRYKTSSERGAPEKRCTSNDPKVNGKSATAAPQSKQNQQISLPSKESISTSSAPTVSTSAPEKPFEANISNFPKFDGACMTKKEASDRLVGEEKTLSLIPLSDSPSTKNKSRTRNQRKKNQNAAHVRGALLPTIDESGEDSELEERYETTYRARRDERPSLFMSDDGRDPPFPPVSQFYPKEEDISGRSPAIMPGRDDYEKSLFNKLLNPSFTPPVAAVHMSRTSTATRTPAKEVSSPLDPVSSGASTVPLTTPLLSRAAQSIRSLGSSIFSSSGAPDTPLVPTPLPDRVSLFGRSDDDTSAIELNDFSSSGRASSPSARRQGKLQSEQEAADQAHEERRLRDIQAKQQLESDEKEAILLAVRMADAAEEVERIKRNEAAQRLAASPARIRPVSVTFSDQQSNEFQASFVAMQKQLIELQLLIASANKEIAELRQRLRSRSSSPSSRDISPSRSSSSSQGSSREPSFNSSQIDRWASTKSSKSSGENIPSDPNDDSDDSFEKFDRHSRQSNPPPGGEPERKSPTPDDDGGGDDGDDDGGDDDPPDDGDSDGRGKSPRRRQRKSDPPPEEYPNPLNRRLSKGIKIDLMAWVSKSDQKANQQHMNLQRLLSTYVHNDGVWEANSVRRSIGTADMGTDLSSVSANLTYTPLQPKFDFLDHKGGLTLALFERMASEIWSWVTQSARNVFPNVWIMMTLQCQEEFLAKLLSMNSAICNGKRAYLEDDIVLTRDVQSGSTMSRNNYAIVMSMLYAVVFYRNTDTQFESLVVDMYDVQFAPVKDVPRRQLTAWIGYASFHITLKSALANFLYRYKMIAFVNRRHMIVTYTNDSKKSYLGARRLLENQFRVKFCARIFQWIMTRIEFRGKSQKEGMNPYKPKTVKELFQRVIFHSRLLSDVTTEYDDEMELFREQAVANAEPSTSDSRGRDHAAGGGAKESDRKVVVATSHTLKPMRIPSNARRFIVADKPKVKGSIPSKFHFLTTREFGEMNIHDEFQMINLDADDESTNVLLHAMKQGTMDDYHPPKSAESTSPAAEQPCLLMLWHGICKRPTCPFNHDILNMKRVKKELIDKWGRELFPERRSGPPVRLHFMSHDICQESAATGGGSDSDTETEEKKSSSSGDFFHGFTN